jgi:hypothetical protein
MQKMIDSTTSGESKCKANLESVWSVSPQPNCASNTNTTVVTTPPNTNPTVVPATTTTVRTECSQFDKCTCGKYEYCGLCAFTNEYKCIFRANPTTNEAGYGELKCKNSSGTWLIGSNANICTPTVNPTTTTKPMETKPAEPTCGTYGDNLCACTKVEACGMCSFTRTVENKTTTYKKCASKQFSATETGESWCKRELGIWRAGVQTECTPGSFYEAEVKGTVTGTVNDTVKNAIEQVVTKIIADKLGIDASKVDVTVDTTTNSDGTTTFKVAVKVGNTEVSTEKFSDISNIPTSELEAQLAAQGINAQSGTVNIVDNSFAGKLFSSLLFIAVISMLF